MRRVTRTTVGRGTVLTAAVLAVLMLGGAVAMAAPLTKSEFIAKADEICATSATATEKKIATQFPDLATSTKAPSASDLKKLVKVIASGVTSELNKIKALGFPKGDEAELNKIISSAKKELKALIKKPSLLLSDSANPLNQSSALAASYGFQTCGQNT